MQTTDRICMFLPQTGEASVFTQPFQNILDGGFFFGTGRRG